VLEAARGGASLGGEEARIGSRREEKKDEARKQLIQGMMRIIR
jgi:hypothetical protein